MSPFPLLPLLAQPNNQPAPVPGDAPPETSAGVDASDLLERAYAYLTQNGVAFLLNLVAALAIFFIGRWIARLLVQLTRSVARRAHVDETLVGFLGNIVGAFLLAFVVLASLARLGVDTTSFAAVIAAAGLAVGLALQDSLSNFASGVMLVLFKPFKAGDFVEAAGTKGVVEEIHIFHTRMRTGDNVQIIVPNGEITSGVITNYSTKPTRRIDLVVGCGYDDDLRAVKAFLVELIGSDDRILADPEPVVAVSELGSSSVNFVVRPWVNADEYWTVRWDLTERIKTGFDDRGFSIPYPQTDVHVHGVEGAA